MKFLFTQRGLTSPAIFIAVMILSILAAIHHDYRAHPPFAEEAAIAKHLLHGDGFLSPYDSSPSAPPSSWSPPLYPAIIALSCKIFGQSAAVTFLMLLNSAAYAAIALALYKIAAATISPVAGLLAVVLVALHPIFLNFSSDFWDSFLALAIFLWLLFAALKIPASPRPFRAAIFMGAAMAILSLTNASYILAYPLIILIALRRRPFSIKSKASAAAFLTFIAILSPWTIRNEIVFHRLQYVRGGASFELSMGNQSFATGWMEPLILTVHPARNPVEKFLLLNVGEPAYFDLCRQRLVTEYANDPSAFWLRTGRRLCYLFLSDPTTAASHYPFLKDIRWHGYIIDRLLMNADLAILGLAGAWTALRLRYKIAWILPAAFLAEIPFLFASVGDRYTLPLRAALIFFTAFLLWAVAIRLKTRQFPRPLWNPPL